jgi:hypothetical protein
MIIMNYQSSNQLIYDPSLSKGTDGSHRMYLNTETSVPLLLIKFLIRLCVVSQRSRSLKAHVFWDVAPCRLINRYFRCGRSYCLRLNGKLVLKDSLLSFQNVGYSLQVDMAQYPRRHPSSASLKPQTSHLTL